MEQKRIIRRPAVTELTGLPKPTIYSGIREGWFPQPVKLGPRAVGWFEHEISDWLETRQRVGGE